MFCTVWSVSYLIEHLDVSFQTQNTEIIECSIIDVLLHFRTIGGGWGGVKEGRKSETNRIFPSFTGYSIDSQ